MDSLFSISSPTLDIGWFFDDSLLVNFSKCELREVARQNQCPRFSSMGISRPVRPRQEAAATWTALLGSLMPQTQCPSSRLEWHPACSACSRLHTYKHLAPVPWEPPDGCQFPKAGLAAYHLSAQLQAGQGSFSIWASADLPSSSGSLWHSSFPALSSPDTKPSSDAILVHS